jgi:acyl-coenzyme A thioesterase PaaI-like protein
MDILSIWKKFLKFPGGAYFFSRWIKFSIPYTGSVSPRVLRLEAGFAVVQMKDCRAYRNHLSSLHAIALANLAEFSSGLALVTAVPPNARAILKSITIEYIKKARGTVVAESKHSPISVNEKREYTVEATIKNQQGELLCRSKALWLVGPK